MKKLAFFAAGLPGMSLAHGSHAPVPELVHGTAHTVPVAAVVLIIVAAVLAWTTRMRS